MPIDLKGEYLEELRTLQNQEPTSLFLFLCFLISDHELENIKQNQLQRIINEKKLRIHGSHSLSKIAAFKSCRD